MADAITFCCQNKFFLYSDK